VNALLASDNFRANALSGGSSLLKVIPSLVWSPRKRFSAFVVREKRFPLFGIML